MSQVTVRENPYASHLFPETVQRLFRAHSLGDVVEVVPVKKGFTNRVQRINDRYILKVCGSAANEQNLAREVFLYRLFRGALPVPEPLVADATRHMIPASYMIYEALPGETLYACWSRLEVSERQDIIRQFCAMLRIIAETSYEPFARQFSIALPLRWHDQRLDALQQCLASVAGHGLLDAPTLRQVQAFVQQHHAALWPQHVGLTYWDVHFDNILVMGSRIAGLLDMERTDVMSLDYVLHTVRRLSRYPRLYAAEDEESLIVPEDYAHLMDWFKTYYPELFAFERLATRLDLYSLEYDLRLLPAWPSSAELRTRLAEDVGQMVRP